MSFCIFLKGYFRRRVPYCLREFTDEEYCDNARERSTSANPGSAEFIELWTDIGTPCVSVPYIKFHCVLWSAIYRLCYKAFTGDITWSDTIDNDTPSDATSVTDSHGAQTMNVLYAILNFY